MKSKQAVVILQLILLGAPAALAKGDMKPLGEGALRVDVHLDKKFVHDNVTPFDPPGVYSCGYTITNVSKERVEFAMYSCSVWDNWSTDSKEVFVKTGGCRANVLVDHVLQPNDSFKGDVDVTALAPIESGTRTFHLILTPCSADHEHPKQLNHFLSNFISINIHKPENRQPASW